MQSRCDLPQPNHLRTKRRQDTRCRKLPQTTAGLTTAGTAAEQRRTERPLPEHTRRQKGCPTVGFASQPGGVGAQSNARSVRLWFRPHHRETRHKNRQGRKTPGSTGTQHSITFQPQSRSLFRTPVPVSSSAPPAPSGLRPDPSWDPTREPTAAGESRFSPRCSRSGQCCPAARGAAAWHARG